MSCHPSELDFSGFQRSKWCHRNEAVVDVHGHGNQKCRSRANRQRLPPIYYDHEIRTIP